MYANTFSNYPTHFLQGVNLIQEARSKYSVASENWPYPTSYKIGEPINKDLYYAEIWKDGMDWQHNYWIIESAKYNEPIAYPILKFSDHSEEEKFNSYDFSEFMRAILAYIRYLNVEIECPGSYNDIIWPFVFVEYKKNFWLKGFMEHSSQPRVSFEINENCVPRSRLFNKEKIDV